MLWIFSALCKAVWLIRNALSNTGTDTGIESHSRTDSDTEHRCTQWGKAAVLVVAGAAPCRPLARQLHRPFLLTVCPVGADLHQGPGEAGPLVIVRDSQLRRDHRELGYIVRLVSISPTPNWGTSMSRAPTAVIAAVLGERQRHEPPKPSSRTNPAASASVPQKKALSSAWFWGKVSLWRAVAKPTPWLKYFRFKVRPWSLQAYTRLFNLAHVSWPFEVSKAVPKCNCLQDQSQRAL